MGKVFANTNAPKPKLVFERAFMNLALCAGAQSHWNRTPSLNCFPERWTQMFSLLSQDKTYALILRQKKPVKDSKTQSKFIVLNVEKCEQKGGISATVSSGST